MSIQEWFDKRKEAQIERRAKEMRGLEDSNPGLWVKCVHCDSQILKSELEDNLMVCPHCDYHFRINARTRISQLFDRDSFEELFKGVKPTDPLNFVDTESYAERLKKAHDKTGLDEAVITGESDAVIKKKDDKLISGSVIIAGNCYAKVDKDKIKQIMIILIDNAIKFTSEEEKLNDALKVTSETSKTLKDSHKELADGYCI